MADRNAYRQPQTGSAGFVGTRKMFGGSASILAADLAAGKTTALFVVPKGFVVTGILAVVPDMDTGASLTFDIGDATVNNRFVAASTTGQAGGNVTTLAAAGLLYEFTADTEIVFRCNAAPAGATAGTLVLYLDGFVRQ